MVKYLISSYRLALINLEGMILMMMMMAVVKTLKYYYCCNIESRICDIFVTKIILFSSYVLLLVVGVVEYCSVSFVSVIDG